MKLRKAVILTAGYGTRLLPATKAQPKAILPIVDKPTIQYAVEEAVASGLDEIVIVMSAGQHVIEDHFDRSWDLERALEAKGDQARLEQLRSISDLADIAYVRQQEQRGIGDAVLTTRHIIGREPFVLFFPDDVIASETPVAKQLVDTFHERGGSVIAVEEVAREDIESYGIVDGEPIDDRVYKLRGLVEKPKLEDAPTNLGIVGRYALTPEIFDVLEETPPGKAGEIQITDGLGLLLKRQPMFALQFEGRRYDTGRPLGLIKASIELALARDDVGPGLREFLRSLDLDS
ncbi:MAG: UTP--glucose-1-phosphate uridylyltransferase GalU [Chloroflexi bacterium]|nr:UTP--glucose-1-phosphate uridylyltransferase GalU [Chloroflexota bacterium]MCI0855800.1 UTP--glucose-1-phosphate uridylyltransferase GalU [Chloroflexota bacterium]MCI0889370.1 UTP--glucose-1-phosphate uridylyltransferase GalU [Chloroflexota bacterium]